MTALEWKKTASSAADSGLWFGIAMGFLGFIIGYVIAVSL